MSFSSGSRGDSQRWNRPVWVPLETYLNHHYSHMADLERYFVQHDGLSFSLETPETIALRGRVACNHGLSMHVDKLLTLDEHHQVSAYSYKYHATIANPLTPVFRYDNAHVYEREGHPDAFHKHIFDPSTGHELIDSPVWIGIDSWPTLRQALDELHQWWHETGCHLSKPD